MKIAIYGATGAIGQQLLRESLQRGHTVTAIVRNPRPPDRY
jgi:putative NADH-flavin reductase